MLLPLRFQLLQPVVPPPPVPGPSGGLSWLRGYRPQFDYEEPASPVPRRQEPREETEALLLLALC
jgi:hypothetical protein